MSRFINLLKGKCPNCEEGKVFTTKGNLLKLRLPVMKERCDVCQHRFEIEPGYFYGAMFTSYGLVILEMFFTFLLSLPFEMAFNTRIAVVIIPMILLSVTNFKYSRLIWMYMFTKKRG